MNMIIKNEYVLQIIADQCIVVDTNAKSVNFNKILALNESGKFLWKLLEEGGDRASLSSALAKNFGIDAGLAEKDADAFICKLEELGCLDYEE